MPRLRQKGILSSKNETRHGKQYRYEMSTQDHEVLLDLLLNHKGPVIISGYDTDLYNTKLASWTRLEFASRTQMSVAKTEILWMNFDPKANGKQMRIEDYGF